MLNGVPFEHMSRDQIAELSVRRGLSASSRSALKTGRESLVRGIAEDNRARQVEMGLIEKNDAIHQPGLNAPGKGG